MTTTVTFASPWPMFIGTLLLPGYVIFLLIKDRLKLCAIGIMSQKNVSAVKFVLWHLRWYMLAMVVSVGLAWTLVVAPHRLFLQIESDDVGLTLNYPWPRSDVRLFWNEISKVEVDARKFRWGHVTRFCLHIRTADSDFLSPWCATDQEVMQAKELIQSHLTKPPK